MKKILFILLAVVSSSAFSECVSTRSDPGIKYCAQIEDVNNEQIKLVKPLSVSLYFNDSGSGIKTIKKRSLCRAFSEALNKPLKYVPGSLVKGYARQRSTSNNQQARLADGGNPLTVIYSINCKFK